MKWFDVIECDNAVEDPLVTDSEDLKGHDEWAFCRGVNFDHWDGTAWIRATEPDGDGTPDDALQNHLMLPIFSVRLRRALEKGGIAGIQYLPVQVFRPDGSPVEGYSIANLLDFVPALDRDRSAFDVYPAEEPFLDRAGEIRVIRKAVLQARVLAGRDLIRLKDYPLSVFASERFKNLVMGGGFTGLGFKEVRVSVGIDASTPEVIEAGKRRSGKSFSQPRDGPARVVALDRSRETKTLETPSSEALPRIETDEDFRNLDEAMGWYWNECGMLPILHAAFLELGPRITREQWEQLPDESKDQWRAVLQRYMAQRSTSRT